MMAMTGWQLQAESKDVLRGWQIKDVLRGWQIKNVLRVWQIKDAAREAAVSEGDWCVHRDTTTHTALPHLRVD